MKHILNYCVSTVLFLSLFVVFLNPVVVLADSYPPKYFTMAEVMQKVKFYQVPFLGAKGLIMPYESYTVKNKQIPDLLYDDIQCTVSRAPVYPDQAPEIFRKFAITNTPRFLLNVLVGGISDWASMYLCVSDSVGNISDSLLASVSFHPTTIKQFKIDRDFNVTICSIVPESVSPILFFDFRERANCKAQRVDVTYRITDQGKFEKTAERKFPIRVFTFEELSDKKLNIWEMQ